MSNIQCYCFHENDDCAHVLVSRPFYPAILECNENFEANLYKEPIDVVTLLEQHDNLVMKLSELGVTVTDVSHYMNYDNLPHSAVGNMVFTRDPIICTQKGVVLGRFKEQVRRTETEILQTLLPKLGINVVGSVTDSQSYIEGGDFITAGDTCFVATGNRTNLDGVREMMNKDLFGTEKVVVVRYPEDGNMHTIHLDCYMGLVGYEVAVLWELAGDYLTVDEYRKCKDSGGYCVSFTNVKLSSYLRKHGWHIVKVPTYSQRNYGCNLLYIGGNTVLTQDTFVTEQLTKLGFNAIFLPFGELHKMYGGIRCATQALLRVPNK